MLVQLLGVFAEFERETIIDSVINGMSMKASKGKWPGGTRPYGYHVDRDSQTTRPPRRRGTHPARDLPPLHPGTHRHPRPSPPNSTSAAYATAPANPGPATPSPASSTTPPTSATSPTATSTSPTPTKPLIDRDTFNQARDIAEARADAHTQRAVSPSEYHLTGLITCPDCGRKYIGTAATGRSRTYRYYTCFSRNRYGAAGCQAARLAADATDQAVLQALFDFYTNAEPILAKAIMRLEAFRKMIRQHVERELERRAYRAGERLTREVLTDKPLFALSPDEVAQMKAVVARLARKIKDALAMRQRQEEKGRLDSRRTIRKSLQYGGIPMEIRFRRRHREKPKLVTLCDVSDSVRNASRFMLQLVWSLQECFSRVRSYVFVSEIAEVTQAFNTYTVDRAIDWALKASPVDYHCRSDFGYAFNRFSHTEIESLDRKTTVLILGDARNNYNDPQAWAIRQIRERVKGIIWLNPEGQWGWGIGDSVMPLYAPACDIVKECRTMGQLVEVVDQLVHQWWRRGR